MHKIKLLLLVSLFFFTCFVSADENHSILISDIRINEAPPTVSVLAAYAKIQNMSDKAQTLTSVSSPSFSKIELHLSKVVNDVAKMEKQDSLTIPAKGSVELSPGAYHLMLFNPESPLNVGDKQTIIFTFVDGTSISVEANVEKRKSNEQEHHHDSHHQGNH